MTDLIEHAKNLRALLRVYGSPNESPTEKELWCGCRDATMMLGELIGAVTELKAQRDELAEIVADAAKDGSGYACRDKARAALAKAEGEG